MQSNRPITQAKYRELVLSHLAICARKSGLALNALPPSELQKYGVIVEEGAKGCKQLKVKIPTNLGPEKLGKLVRSLEEERKLNKHLFPKKEEARTAPRGRRPDWKKEVPILEDGVEDLPDYG